MMLALTLPSLETIGMSQIISWLGFVAIAAVAVAGGYYLWKRREALAPPAPKPERHLESTRFEQILAELQGLKLRIQGGEGRGVFVKTSRLVRIFADRAGIPGARDMNEVDLRKAMEGNIFSVHQAQTLARIVDRCELAAREETLKLDFDPVEMVQEFRDIIYQIEGHETA